MSANTQQIGGSHYASAYQHWDYVWRLKLGYFPGQITKYALRWRKKNGAQDLEKAVHFAEKYQELLAAGLEEPTLSPRTGKVGVELAHFAGVNDLDKTTLVIFGLLSHAHDVNSVVRVKILLLSQLAKLQAEALAPGAPTPAYVNQDR